MPTRATPAERSHALVDSPCGPLTLVAEGEWLVGLYMEDQRHRPDASLFGPRTAAEVGAAGAPFAETARQLAEYFAGRREVFDLPLRPRGTEFQRRVWRALLDIPYGSTWTYARLAAHIGRPTASRAVGLANGKNPLGVIVPCHRVLGSDGSLTGYGGGLERKRALLAHEGALRAPGEGRPGAQLTAF
ncbi:methylated-DNA--[protein]-cysteine S-methyltransferase [Streptomyces sp. DSM 44917]|uniref:Methylated-DNA--protein-cysteine methyltransferase n=1 Tax=Streptomyces boetiae TaxID=3075541 RepID=A0ABU2L959_9ACTN|nr:methylated-DNA--[protein]-cysteine S-methyltransferase [Streptomyces sp. DSM 44917]MDT0308025.1 methylated-DNA--[protein]-cysteine S-methyltransferase [Streptomyces sp. DSM 44917]